MKVYVVTYSNKPDEYIEENCGVFTSRKMAEDYVNAFKDYGILDRYNIEEHILNNP